MKNIFSIVFVLSFMNIYSQNGDNLHKEDRGNIIITQNNDIKGTCYIYEKWNKGMLVLNDSVFSVQDYLKFDAFKNKLYIKKENEIIEISDKSVTGFSILEKDKNIKHDFVKLHKNNFTTEAENGFYELVFNVQNTNYFIKKNSKILYDPNRSKGSQTINNFPLEYQDKTTYFIKNDDGLYVHIKLKKRDIKTLLANHSKQMEAFVKTNKINYSKESDVVKLVNYYYSL